MASTAAAPRRMARPEHLSREAVAACELRKEFLWLLFAVCPCPTLCLGFFPLIHQIPN